MTVSKESFKDRITKLHGSLQQPLRSRLSETKDISHYVHETLVMARTLRTKPSALRIAIRFLTGAYAPCHQAAAADSRPREQARVSVSR